MSSNDGRNYRGELGPYDWDWTKLNDSFDRGIRVGDIDLFVEAGGHFLIGEAKAYSGPLPKGQGMALRAISKLPSVTVVAITGTPPDIIRGWFVRGEFSNELETRKYEGDYQAFGAFVRLWFEFADNNK